MKAILLNGSKENDRTGERIRVALEAELKNRGWDIEHFNLCERKIGNCAGDFFCWIRTPGMCNVNDDNRLIAEALATCDLLVYLTPVTFGGYSATLKRMVDHQIQNYSPFFAMIEGETHHLKRYKKNPDLLAVGWMTAPDMQSEAIFRYLVQRNAINFHTKTYISGVVLAGQSDNELQTSAQKWLDNLQDGRSSARVDLPNCSNKYEPNELDVLLRVLGLPTSNRARCISPDPRAVARLMGRSTRVDERPSCKLSSHFCAEVCNSLSD